MIWQPVTSKSVFAGSAENWNNVLLRIILRNEIALYARMSEVCKRITPCSRNMNFFLPSKA
jgi:hypothetical protein